MKEKTNKIMKYTALCLIAVIVMSTFVIVGVTMKKTASSVFSEAGGMKVDQITPDGVSMIAAEISPAEYGRYGISPLAETAYTLTATVNEDATEKTVNWTTEFENSASDWATGKTVTDYVTVSTTGALTATVSCMRAFGERILVSAVSKDDPQVKATCTCDYQKQLIGMDFRAESNTTENSIEVNHAELGTNLGKIHFYDSYQFGILPIFSDGTIEAAARFYFYSIDLTVPKAAADKIEQQSGFSLQGVKDSFSIPFVSAHNVMFDDQVLLKLFGTEVLAESDKLYSALKSLDGTYKDLIEVVVSFTVDEGALPYDGLKQITCYLDIDVESLYKPVSDVQVDKVNVAF